MRLDLSSLKRAIAQLEGALRYHDSELSRQDAQLRKHLRAAAIQAFEFTYEMSHKMLRRFLAATEPNPAEVASLEFPALIRLGTQRGLLRAELARWKTFRSNRGATSHAHAEDTAEEIFAGIPLFLDEARFLLSELERRNVDEVETTAPVDIRADHLTLLEEILARSLPPGARTWVFGSRTRWTAHAGSDLDLAIDAGRPLSSPETVHLKDELEESDLPYKVDVVDLHRVSESFREVIERDRVLLPEPGPHQVTGA